MKKFGGRFSSTMRPPGRCEAPSALPFISPFSKVMFLIYEKGYSIL